MTFLVTFLETVLVSAPSFSLLFYFQSQLTQKLFLQITHTPLPSVHFLYSYYINLLKKKSQTKPAHWSFLKVNLLLGNEMVVVVVMGLGCLSQRCWSWAFYSTCGAARLLQSVMDIPLPQFCASYLTSGLLCLWKTYKRSFKTWFQFHILCKIRNLNEMILWSIINGDNVC